MLEWFNCLVLSFCCFQLHKKKMFTEPLFDKQLDDEKNRR